ncbi:MAG: OmpA family protein [Methylococcaceae bacterium]|nr:OmpA family protein [Methylococcaceae bacterium]
MKKLLLVSASIAGAVLSGCATQPATFKSFQAKDLNHLTKSAEYKQKANNFFVINDSSDSMEETYIGNAISAEPSAIKLEIEKELLSRMNKTIPNITLTSGLRSFGYGKCVSLGGYSTLNQAVQSYSKSAFNSAIESLACASGGSPMDKAIATTQADLTANSGNTALIIFSDGHDLDGSPVASATALKARYGDKLCIYTVWVGNPDEVEGRRTLLNVSNKGACGFSALASDIASPEGMAKFVEQVFFKRVALVASEGDADLDGVLDSKDQCPQTPLGATVNVQGCWIIKGIHFDTARHNIKSKYHHLLNNAATVLKRNPGLTIEVQGHTDNVGSDKYNLGLSERRANAVKHYLGHKAGKSASLTSKGYGETKPVVTNETAEGRAINRRVQLEVIKR